jgi:hypothetical protein
MTAVNRATLIERNRNAADGVKEHLKGAVQLAGGTYKVADILAILAAPAAAADTTDKTKAAWRAAVVDERTAKAAAKGMRVSLQNYLIGIHGTTSTVLADFGFVIKKPAPKTVEVKAGAAKKMRATREARGTMGKKQKAQIKGTVEIDATALAALQTAAAASTATTTTAAATTGSTAQGAGKTGNQ